ncbi:alpha/beta hydrolase [Bacillus sp. REN3]|uniref:alpha/beta hydrolase n=1 Tax=Bacillus sp. REN3 TaxID=2802440 RepID=UPI001AEE1B37|nr:alpha/beta hydrolase [Bacillus sp. REN3]
MAGIRLHYEYLKCAKPSDDTVLFLHGVGLDMSIWDDVIPLFLKEFNVLRCDLPGHGKSTKPDGTPYTWELMVKSVKMLLSKLAIPSVHVIGHSGGGNLALELAMRDRQLINSLTLAATPVFVPKEVGRKELIDRSETVSQCDEFEKMIGRLVNTISYQGSSCLKAKLSSIYSNVSADDYIGYFKLATEAILNYSMEELRNLGIPMMMLQGEFDRMFPLEFQVMNISYLKKIRFFIIPDTGNVLMMEEPRMFASFSIRFIQSISAETEKEDSAFTYTYALKKEADHIVATSVKRLESNQLLEISFLSGFSIWLNGKEVCGKWNQRKAKELVIYIAYHQSVTREQLYDQFWPELTLEKARNQLRVSLNHIKSIFEEHTGESIDNYLLIDRDSIHMKVKCRMDFHELIDCIEQIEREPDVKQKAVLAIRKFSGLPDPLFPLFYDDWFLKIRTNIESRIIHICENLLYDAPGKEEAIALLKILLKISPGEAPYEEHLDELQGKANRNKGIGYFRKMDDSSFL